MSQRATVSKRTAVRRPLAEPYLLFLIFLGIGIGTIMLGQPVRLALLWTTLVILSVVHRHSQSVEVGFSLVSIGRGALLGLVISLPILAFLAHPLRLFNERLYGSDVIVFLFYQVCFVSAPVEEYFFRGIIQERYGSSVSVALYALTALLYFLPHAPLLATFIVFVAMGLLGVVYGYVRERYGLAAAIAAHVMVSLVLQVLPSTIFALRAMLS